MLALLSTSLVSGIFAKYVVTKDASTVVSLKKFGVKLAIQQGDDFAASGATVTAGAISDSSLTATVTVTLVPSTTAYDEIIKFVPTIDSTVGKASVKTNIKVKAEVVALSNNSYNSKYYVPAAFYVNGSKASSEFISNTNANTLKTTLGNNINGGIKTALGAGDADTNGFYSKQLVDANGTNVSIAKIGFGVSCPFTSTVTDADAMITQLAEQGATVTIKYTVSLEQAA